MHFTAQNGTSNRPGCNHFRLSLSVGVRLRFVRALSPFVMLNEVKHLANEWNYASSRARPRSFADAQDDKKGPRRHEV